MQGVRANDSEAVRYKWLLGEINELFVKTHGIVLNKLEAIENAKSVSDAQAFIKELRTQALSESFHAQGLCDVFVGFGIAFAGLNSRVSMPLAPATDLAQRLQNREYEVATMYGDQILQMSALLDADASASLVEIQNRASAAKQEIIAQMGDFSQLAKDFKNVDVT